MQRISGRFTLPAAPSGNQIISAPYVHREETLIVALRGRPRLGEGPFSPGSIAREVAAAYRESGLAVLPQLRGPFAVAILDTANESCALAIDRMGIEMLCWAQSGDDLHFGTSSAEIAAALPGTPQLNHQALFDYMLRHMIPAPDTAYVGISKLDEATCLRLEKGRVRIERYWTPSFARAAAPDIDALEAAMLPTLRQAVADCEPDERTGAFLSGGLDSSTLAGILTTSRTTPTTAFSVGFGVEEFNELRFARIAVERFGCNHVEYEVTPADIVELIPRIAAAYDEPFGNSSAVPTFCCSRVAKSHGIDHLIAGDGGDELFGGNERYVRHRIFEAYRRLPGVLRSALLEPLAARLDPDTAPLPLRKFSSYVRQARIPLPERFESWNMIYREGAATVFDPDFLSSVDTDYPLRQMREVWTSCPSDDLLDRMLWYDWKYTVADNDLRKVTRMTELADVRVSYPMLSEELIDLSLQVPSDAKIAGSELRAFYKKSMRNFLPDEIIRKKKHGFGLPFGVWAKSDAALRELVNDSLAALKQRGIIAAAFIDRANAEHTPEDASYYGSAIWDMVMLEQWLEETERARAAQPALQRATTE